MVPKTKISWEQDEGHGSCLWNWTAIPRRATSSFRNRASSGKSVTFSLSKFRVLRGRKVLLRNGCTRPDPTNYVFDLKVSLAHYDSFVMFYLKNLLFPLTSICSKVEVLVLFPPS
jgi:hypothetical protein